MLMSTTTAIEGRPVSRYYGVVTGEAIIGATCSAICSRACATSSVDGPRPTNERWRKREVAMKEMEKRASDSAPTASSASTSTTKCWGRRTAC